jgi:hypothetical protein
LYNKDTTMPNALLSRPDGKQYADFLRRTDMQHAKIILPSVEAAEQEVPRQMRAGGSRARQMQLKMAEMRGDGDGNW